MKTRRWAVGAFLCVLAGSRARADVHLVKPSAGSVLEAGSVVEVHWTGVPAGSDELELLLSLQEDARVPVRLTGELHGETSSFRWRVPNLPAASARLVVRYENEGREEEAEAGPVFSIVADGARPIETVRFHRGEVWLGAGPVGSGAPEAVLGEGRDSRVGPGAEPHPALASFRDEVTSGPAGPHPRSRAASVEPQPVPGSRDPEVGLPRAIPQRK